MRSLVTFIFLSQLSIYQTVTVFNYLGAMESIGPSVSKANIKEILSDNDNSIRFKKMEQAAALGNVNAMCYLAMYYECGTGIEKDLQATYMWAYIAGKLATVDNQEMGHAFAKNTSSRMSYQLGSDKITHIVKISDAWITSRNGIPQYKSSDIDIKGAPSIGLEWMPAGTGFLVTKRAIVTAAHVVGKSKYCKVNLDNKDHDGEVIERDSANDAAVILLKDPSNAPALSVAKDRVVSIGSKVWTLGFPNTSIQGSSVKLTEGSISATTGLRDEPRWFQISVPVQPGNSGGPLLDMKGQVVGIIVARINERTAIESGAGIPQNVNYALKSPYILSLLHNLPREAGSLITPSELNEKSLVVLAESIIPSIGLIKTLQ